MELDLATPTPAATAAAASLAPGFRFHPTDEELVRYYLKRKVCGKPFRFDAISEIDIYKTEPWDLPEKSRLKSRDLEWYFFSVLDKKYGNGSKTNRATEKGYWKTTGKDRPVYNRSKTVGMKKTLVFHSGRAPRGQRTNWVMHEYRLVDEDLGKAGFAQDAFVLCRVFQKSGTGPKNGEQYGAPFVEEEWEEDQLVMVPGQMAAEDGAVDEGYLDGDDLQQILEAGIPSEEVSPPLGFYYDDNGSYVPETNLVDDDQKILVDTATSYCAPEQPDDNNLFNLPVEYDADTKPVKHEYIGEPSNSLTSVDEDYLVDEPFLDASDNILFDDGAFLETNDLSHPVQADPSCFDMLDEYLTFFNADEANLDYMPYDSTIMTGSENLLPNQQFLSQKQANMEAPEETGGSQPLLPGNTSNAASTSKKKSGNFGDMHYPFLEQANRMLGSIPAPPAFASEFPSKEAALRFNSPSPVRVTAGMIQIRNMPMGGNGTSWALGKHLDINIILSFGMPQNSPASPVSPGSMSKASSVITRGFLYLLFGWFVILSMSFKIGAFIYTGKAS